MFNPLILKHLTAKNRLVRSATNEHLGDADGYVSDALVEVYRELAKNEVGLIISSHFCVAAGGRAEVRHVMASEDRYISGLSRLPDAVHPYGAKLVAQINHLGSKARPSANLENSMLTSSTADQHEQMTVEQIHETVQAYVSASVRVKAAGFDGVQVHCAHGYLLTQFLDPSINTRRDAYGGSPERRFRIVRDIVEGIHAACGGDYPVFVKINCNSSAADDYDFLQIAQWLEELDIEAIEISGFDFSSFDKAYPTPYYIEQALAVKQKLSIPVILVGGLHDGDAIGRTLAAGIDAVSLSRAFIREPDLAAKLKADAQYAARCVRCNQCFRSYSAKHKRCVFDRQPNEQLMINYRAAD